MAVVCTGFGYQTSAGAATGNATNKLFDSLTGTVSFDNTTPRTGTHCLQIACTASNAIGWTTDTLGTSNTRLVASGWIYISTDPTAGTQWGYFGTAAAAESISMEYHFGSDIIRLWSAATATGQDSTTLVVAGQWYHIDIRYNVAANPWVIEWRINGIEQPSFSPARAASTVASWRFGSLGFANGGTFRYDDWIMSASTTGAEYPYGPHTVPFLSVDPAGTVTLSGTAANFNVFTGATPTLAAWNATTARDRVDEVPPNLTSAQDGACQITAAATEYMQFPMTSYTLKQGETVTAARAEMVGWQASTASGTIGLRSWNGTTETTLLAAQAHTNLGNNTSTPGWICKMLTVADIDTQAELDALEFRVGFSGDATPDMGLQAMYAEVAVKENQLPNLVMARWNN